MARHTILVAGLGLTALSCAARAADPGQVPAAGLQDPTTLGASAAQPGDEGMSCEAIIAEMKTVQVSGVSAEHRAEAQAAGQALKGELDQQTASAAGQMAAQTAATAAASAA